MKKFFNEYPKEKVILSVHPNNIAMLKTLIRIKNDNSKYYKVKYTRYKKGDTYSVDSLNVTNEKVIILNYNSFPEAYNRDVPQNDEKSYLGYHRGKTSDDYPPYIIAVISEVERQDDTGGN